MGGAFTAVASDENTLHYNPAGLGFLKRKHGTFILNLNLAFDANTYRVHRFLIRNFLELREVFYDRSRLTDAFFQSMKEIDQKPTYLLLSHRAMEVVGPQSGFCLYEENLSQHLFQRGERNPRLSFMTASRLIATYGYSRNMSLGELGKLSIGLAFRYAYRFATTSKLLIHSVEALENYYYSLKIEDLYRRMIQRSHALAVDMGYLYEIKAWALRVGLVIRNFMAHRGAYRLPRTHIIGAAFRLTELIPLQTVKELLFAADYWDIYGKGQTPSQKLRVGMEVALSALRLRLGSRGGKLTYGAGLRLGFIRLEYAYAPFEYPPLLWWNVPEYKHFLELRMGQ